MCIRGTAAAVSPLQVLGYSWFYVLSVSLSDLSLAQLTFSYIHASLEIACIAVQFSFAHFAVGLLDP